MTARGPAEVSPLDERSMERLAAALEQRLRIAMSQTNYAPGSATSQSATKRNEWLITMGKFAIAALLAYGVVNARLAVVESKQSSFEQSLIEMRNDIKTLLQRTR